MTRTPRPLSTKLLWAGGIATALMGLAVLLLWVLGPGIEDLGVWNTVGLLIALNGLIYALAALFIGVTLRILDRDQSSSAR